MTDVIALSELSDEPIAYPALTGQAAGSLGRPDFSPRLEAVLDRMANNSTGTATRVKGGLRNAGIWTANALDACGIASSYAWSRGSKVPQPVTAEMIREIAEEHERRRR